MDILSTLTLLTCQSTKTSPSYRMVVGDEIVKMQINSGVSCNVLPRKRLHERTVILKTNLKLTAYSRTNLIVLELAKITLRNQEKGKEKVKKEQEKILSGICSCPRKLHSSSWFLSDTANETNNCPTAEHFASKRRCG